MILTASKLTDDHNFTIRILALSSDNWSLVTMPHVALLASIPVHNSNYRPIFDYNDHDNHYRLSEGYDRNIIELDRKVNLWNHLNSS